MEQRTTETLKSLSVTTIRSVRQPVATLSGGQRQSVAVARAVMWNNRVVFLDEPTAALGVAQTRQVLDLVKRLGEQGLAVAIVSHNLNDVFEVADRITVLRLGHNVGVYERDKTNQQEIVVGVVFVLLIGEIDLSIGYVSGIAGVVVAELQAPGSGHQWPGLVAIACAIGAGAAIGAVQGSIVAIVGVPSFVVTLAGLLIWQGVILKDLGTQGVIGIQDKQINDVANYVLTKNTGWVIAIVFTAGLAAASLGA